MASDKQKRKAAKKPASQPKPKAKPAEKEKSKAAPAKDTDYGDMGTAFGLDASMDTLPMPEEGSAAKKDNGRPPPEGAGRRTKR